ncbi:hypothetical protein ACFTSF_04695 [Kribbella sp. NPDC056951]|uniref:hypothetical protein n=1 Tax=Kribbella sp. NPDC056951 TaxID=3345978 RepID=UPI003640CB2B
MEASINDLSTLAAHFKVNDSHAPLEVVQALATLIGGDALVQGVAAITEPLTSTDGNERTIIWDCMAIAGDMLISVRGYRFTKEWSWSVPRRGTTTTAPGITGWLEPLSEVAACQLVGLTSGGPERWTTRWEIRLKSGETRPVPWSDPDIHEAFADAVARRLRRTG